MSGASPAYNDLISKQLQKTTNELRQLQQFLTMDEIEPRILLDFREAVDNVRHIAWAVQQWMELKSKKADVTSVLSVLTNHRVRVTSRLTKDLAVGVESGEVTRATEGLELLWKQVHELIERLAKLLGR